MNSSFSLLAFVLRSEGGCKMGKLKHMSHLGKKKENRACYANAQLLCKCLFNEKSCCSWCLRNTGCGHWQQKLFSADICLAWGNLFHLSSSSCGSKALHTKTTRIKCAVTAHNMVKLRSEKIYPTIAKEFCPGNLETGNTLRQQAFPGCR